MTDQSNEMECFLYLVLKLFRFAFTFLFFNMLPFCNRPLNQQVWIEVIPKVKQKQRSLWQVQHEPSKSGPVFILKVVDTYLTLRFLVKVLSFLLKIVKFTFIINFFLWKNGRNQWVLRIFHFTKISILFDRVSWWEK